MRYKGALYAEAGIANYWLFNLVEHRLEVYSEPYRDMQGKGNYAQRHAQRRYVLAHQSIALTVFSNLNLKLEISNVLPKI